MEIFEEGAYLMKRTNPFHILNMLLMMGGLLVVASFPIRAEVLMPNQNPEKPYPYRSDAFHQFVRDSYRQAGHGNPQEFYAWMEEAARRHHLWDATGKGEGWSSFLAAKRRGWQKASVPSQRAAREMQFAAWLHTAIKTIIPHFSLDRGFEFTNVVVHGERQCFLQSVLIAGLLQSAGLKAGVVMVNRNMEGQWCNNGHAVVLLKLSNGKDILVDASDPEPFARQQGIFGVLASQSDYRYATPIYEGRSPFILRYRLSSTSKPIPTQEWRGLDIPFLRSQFEYYRGERVAGGLLSKRATPHGLTLAAQHFQSSLRWCPQNPLSAYMLGRVYRRMGNIAAAREQLQAAYRLYARFGWIPEGLRQALVQEGKPPYSSHAKLHEPLR